MIVAIVERYAIINHAVYHTTYSYFSPVLAHHDRCNVVMLPDSLDRAVSGLWRVGRRSMGSGLERAGSGLERAGSGLGRGRTHYQQLGLCSFPTTISFPRSHIEAKPGISLLWITLVFYKFDFLYQHPTIFSCSFDPPNGNRLVVVGGLVCPFDLVSRTRGGLGLPSSPRGGRKGIPMLGGSLGRGQTKWFPPAASRGKLAAVIPAQTIRAGLPPTCLPCVASRMLGDGSPGG